MACRVSRVHFCYDQGAEGPAEEIPLAQGSEDQGGASSVAGWEIVCGPLVAGADAGLTVKEWPGARDGRGVKELGRACETLSG